MNESALVRAVAAVLWADQRVEAEELAGAKILFERHRIDWGRGRPMLEQEIEAWLDPGEEEEAESESPVDFGVIDLGEGVDHADVLCELAELACADGVLDWTEIDVLHRLAEAMNQPKELVTAAVALAVAKGAKVQLESEVLS